MVLLVIRNGTVLWSNHPREQKLSKPLHKPGLLCTGCRSTPNDQDQIWAFRDTFNGCACALSYLSDSTLLNLMGMLSFHQGRSCPLIGPLNLRWLLPSSPNTVLMICDSRSRLQRQRYVFQQLFNNGVRFKLWAEGINSPVLG